jgi:dipeptidase D
LIETDGILCIGSAGTLKIGPTLAYNTTATPKDYVSYQLSVSGLTGGHSGVKIVNGGSNAIKLLGDFLSKQTDLRLAAISGGSFPNVIADSASTTVSLPSTQKENFEKDWNAYVAEIKKKYATTDPDMVCEIKSVTTPSESMTDAHTKATFNGLAKAAQGVTEWSKTIDNMFEVSNNVGSITMKNGVLNIVYLTRGFESKKIDGLANAIIAGFEESKVGFTCRKSDFFSSWNPNINSTLMNYSRVIYQQHFGKPIILQKTGGGLELSEFALAYPDMEFISYGPTIFDPHTIKEALEIKTVQNCWEYTVELLENISDLNEKKKQN